MPSSWPQPHRHNVSNAIEAGAKSRRSAYLTAFRHQLAKISSRRCWRVSKPRRLVAGGNVGVAPSSRAASRRIARIRRGLKRHRSMRPSWRRGGAVNRVIAALLAEIINRGAPLSWHYREAHDAAVLRGGPAK